MQRPLVVLLLLCVVAAAQERPKVLFLSHSAGFVHPVVKRPTSETLALAEERLRDLGKGKYAVTPSQDAASLTPEMLADYGAVVFMTTGEIPLPQATRDALFRRLRAGGGLVGIHCATDTYYKVSTWADMIGGVFAGHPWTQRVRLRVEQPTHSIAAPFASNPEIDEEIYQFKNFRRAPLDVVLSLDLASVDAAKGQRTDGDYALAWTRAWGAGRVFYTALGHGPSAWNDPRFLAHLENGIDWALDPRPKPPRALPSGAVAGVPGNGPRRTWELRSLHFDAEIHLDYVKPAPTADGKSRRYGRLRLGPKTTILLADDGGGPTGSGSHAAIDGVRAPDEAVSIRGRASETIDIAWTAPRVRATGIVKTPARISVWHNGIPVHRNVVVDDVTTTSTLELDDDVPAPRAFWGIGRASSQ